MVSDISYTTKKYLALLMAMIFIVSFSFSLYYKIRPTVDAKAYSKIAWNLTRGYGYIEDEQNILTPEKDDAIVRVGPGYEFFLAGIYSVFGYNFWIIWLIQALLRMGTAYILFRIVLLLFEKHTGRETIGLLTVALFGFTPDLIILGGMLLAETLFVATLVCALYVSLRALEEKKSSLLASLMWGVSALIRPTALVPAVLYTAYVYITKHSAMAVMIALLFPVLLLGSWSVRNSLLYHTPLFTTTAGTYALWVGNNPGATGGFDKTLEIQDIRDKNHSVELAKISIHKYFEFLRDYPMQFVAIQIKKTSMYFSVLRPSGFWFYLAERPVDRLLTLISSSLMTGFLFIAGGAGMYLYARRREKYHWFLISVALLQPLSVIPTYVETRYRVPFFPFLALFAAYLLYVLWQRDKANSNILVRALLFSAILIALLTLGDILYSYDIIIERLRILFSQLSRL